MEADLAQIIAFCVVMLENALAEPGILEGVGISIESAAASLDTIRAGLDQELGANAAAEALSEIDAATNDMPRDDREEAVAFCAETEWQAN